MIRKLALWARTGSARLAALVVVGCVAQATLVPSISAAGLLGYGAIMCGPLASSAGGADQCNPSERVQSNASGSKIISGRQAADGAYPWVVAVSRHLPGGNVITYCAGSIVAPRWVLTAAHCNVKPDDSVVVGRHDLTTVSGQEIRVAQVSIQPNFDPHTMSNDAALLYLSEAAKAPPIALNHDRDLEAMPDTELSVAGWGSASYLGPPSSVLLENSLYTVDIRGCRSIYLHMGYTVSDTMFCADGKGRSRRSLPSGEFATDVCQSDSGGGAVRWNPFNGTHLLVGILSWGVGCGDSGFPGVYTSVSSIAPWVQQQIQTE